MDRFMEDEEFKFPPSSEYLKRSAERRKWWAQWDSDSDDEEDSLTNDNKIHFIIKFFLQGLRLVAIWSNNDDINQVEKNKHFMLEK